MADVSSKKRKREVGGAVFANKKLAALPQGPIKVQHIEQNGLSPVLVTSKGITVPTCQFHAYVRLERPESKDGPVAPRSHSVVLQSSKHSRLDYIAHPTVDSHEQAHYVAIFDAEKGTLTVTPAYHAHLNAVVRAEPASSDDLPKKTMLEQRMQLGQDFGTKKAKQSIANRTINAITGAGDEKGAEVQAAILDAAAEQAGVAEDQAVQLEKTLRAKPIPMPNLSAQSVEEIYTVDVLVPPPDMRQINVKEWREKIGAGEAIQLYHRYPAVHVQKIGESNNRQKLKALSYMALLLRFHDALRAGGAKTKKKVPKKDILAEKLSDYPESLIDSVRKRFSDENSELGKWHVEKLQTTLCALSLYINDFSTQTDALRDDLKLDNKIISRFFQELGCKVRAMTEAEIERRSQTMKRKFTKAEAALVKVAVLKLPLEFPKLRSGRRG